MAWITPITDRTVTDVLYAKAHPEAEEDLKGAENVVDFNRQKDNITYIATEILPLLYYFSQHTDIADVDLATIPEADLLNAVEQNLAAIAASGVDVPDGWLASKTWADGDHAPDYTDFNRWENNVLLIYEMYQRVRAQFRPAGAFAAGQANSLPRSVI